MALPASSVAIPLGMAGALLLTGELSDSKARLQVQTWLQSIWSNPSAHQATCVFGDILNGTNTITDQHRFGGIGKGVSKTVAALGSAANLLTSLGGSLDEFNSAAAREINAVLDELKNPNIGGIPIHADSEVETSDVEVSQKLLIYEVDSNKDYRVDSSVPKPRTWSIKGYLMSNPRLVPNESQLVIKPSLIAQRQLLQWFVDSRRPVMFKTHDNRFYTCLITHFDSQYTVQSLNSLAVNISLQEFKVMEVNQGTLNTLMTKTTEAFS